MYLLLFDLAGFIGYFLFMITFMVIAIATAKSKTAWIWYAIGAVGQLLSLLGNQKSANVTGADTTIYWIIYFAVLLLTARVVDVRYKKSLSENQAFSSFDNETAKAFTAYDTNPLENQENKPAKKSVLIAVIVVLGLLLVVSFAINIGQYSKYNNNGSPEQEEESNESTAPIHFHNYEVIASETASCTKDGYEDIKCNECGDSYRKEIKASHNYTSATCLEPQKCKDCGKISGSPLGHLTGAKCARCGVITFETKTYHGNGRDSVSNITLPVGEYNVKFTYNGSSNFVVYFCGHLSHDDLAANVVGSSTCIYRINSTINKPVKNAYFNVSMANGPWTITIEAVN